MFIPELFFMLIAIIFSPVGLGIMALLMLFRCLSGEDKNYSSNE